MGLIKGAIDWGTGFNITYGGPIDSRSIVEFTKDLTDESVWKSGVSAYVGMNVTVLETFKVYVLTDSDYTSIENWKEIGIDETVLSDINSEINSSNKKIDTLIENFTWAEFE